MKDIIKSYGFGKHDNSRKTMIATLVITVNGLVQNMPIYYPGESPGFVNGIFVVTLKGHARDLKKFEDMVFPKLLEWNCVHIPLDGGSDGKEISE